MNVENFRIWLGATLRKLEKVDGNLPVLLASEDKEMGCPAEVVSIKCSSPIPLDSEVKYYEEAILFTCEVDPYA